MSTCRSHLPRRAKAHPFQLRECLQEMGRETAVAVLVVLELRTEAVPGVIHGVVSAPEDAAIGGGSVVVELVSHIAQPLAAGPPHRIPLGVRQGLRHEHVVVDRHHPMTHRGNEARVGIRSDDDPARHHTTLAGGDGHPVSVIFELHHLGVLMDSDTLHLCYAGHTPDKTRWVDERHPAPIENTCEIGLRVDHPGDGLAIEEITRHSQHPQFIHGFEQFLNLMRSNGNSDFP